MQLILAPPGAGKTRILVDHIRNRLADGVSPYRILATTFSREAARELAERLDGDVPVRTVHSLALWVVRIAHQARGARPPRVLPAEQAAALLERAMREVGATFLEPGEALAEITRVRERGGSWDALHPALARSAARYFELLRAENRLDFTGILEVARRELADADLLSFLQGLHLFVDEGQDLNPSSEWPVLEHLRQGAAAFVMMASPSQQIYGFKGADWGQLAARFPQTTRTSTLERNYRSTPEIIEASRPLAGPDARHMRAVRPSRQVPVRLVTCLDAELEVEYIGRAIQQWRAAGVPDTQIAILTRTHRLQQPIVHMLRARAIPYSLPGARLDLFQRPEVQAFSGFLALALDGAQGTALEQVIDYPPAGIGQRTRYRLRGDGRCTWQHLTAALDPPDAYPPPVRQRIQRLLAFRQQSAAALQESGPLPHALQRLLALTEIPEHLLGEGDARGLQALEDLLATAGGFASLAQFQAYLAGEIQRPPAAQGIQLASLHAAKGREWTAVLLPHVQEGILPLHEMDPQEEQNLAFVGLTRARDFLTITLARPARPSPFLAGMAGEVQQWP